MAGSYNLFGALPADVYEMYPNAVADTFGGETAVTNAMIRGEAEVLASMPEDQNLQWTKRVEFEALIYPAVGGEATATCGFSPVVDYSVRLYRYPDFPDAKPSFIYDDMPSDEYSVSSGIVTLVNPMLEGEWLFASYEIDPTDSTFAIQLYAQAVVYYACAELGKKTFTRGQEDYSLVDMYQKMSDDCIDSIRAGDKVPHEFRRLTFWEDIKPNSENSLMSLRKYRG